MTILLLIRHGENDYLKNGILIGNTPGVHLNPAGQKQALLLRDALKQHPIKAIYSSPLERARETAEPLALAVSLEVKICQPLVDTNVGQWAMRKISQLQDLDEWKQVQENPATFQFPGGDSFSLLQSRLVDAIASIASVHAENELVALFFHADPIKLVLAHFLGMPLDNFQRLVVNTGSVSVLKFGQSGIQVPATNLSPPFKLEDLIPSE